EASTILDWWSDRCLEWCFKRVEDGKFCDQKYLDEWPVRFAGVRVLDEPGVGLAPWNGRSHRLHSVGDRIYVDGNPLIFYHFQSLRLYRGFTLPRRLGLASRRFHLLRDPDPLVWSVDRSYCVSPPEEALLYRPYLHELIQALNEVRSAGVDVQSGFVNLPPRLIVEEAARQLTPKVAGRMLRKLRPR